MLDWQNPAWLFSLFAIGPIWWLHRRALMNETVHVSAAFLWASTIPMAEEKKQRAPADSMWLLRAALFSCLIVALANPFLISPERAAARSPATVIGDVSAKDEIALTQLSVRRSSHESDSWNGNLLINSTAQQSMTVPLTIRLKDHVIASTTVQLDPMKTTLYGFTFPNSALGDMLSAQVTSPDARTENDQLQLETSALLPVTTRIAGDCSTYMHAALRSAPGLVVTTTPNNPGVAVICGDASIPVGIATLILHNTDLETSMIAGSVQWRKQDLGFSDLELGSFAVPNVLPQSLPGSPVLTTDNRTLVTVENTLPRRVHVWFDVQQKSLALTPQYPILVNQLVSLALAQDQSDSVAYVNRPHELTALTPARSSTQAPNAQATAQHTTALAPWLIAFAGLLLILDGLWHVRRMQRRD